MDPVQNRGDMGDDPTDLCLPDFAVEDLLQNGCSFFLRQFFIIEVVWV